jgi:hypothetical protein
MVLSGATSLVPPELLRFEIITIWEEVNKMMLNPKTDDSWTWLWDGKGMYCAQSIFRECFTGEIKFDTANAIWKP